MISRKETQFTLNLDFLTISFIAILVLKVVLVLDWPYQKMYI